ncbi:hypothetical protein RJT34_04119 [Clitoria ternatea]|uniref:Uncharacterized protein n=1 Tax=Clitoria ternatea TaxID=43366 RepID=A0AAN9Q5T0_CLITE
MVVPVIKTLTASKQTDITSINKEKVFQLHGLVLAPSFADQKLLRFLRLLFLALCQKHLHLIAPFLLPLINTLHGPLQNNVCVLQTFLFFSFFIFSTPSNTTLSYIT